MVSAINISAGSALTNEMLDIKRPGNGISPSKFENLVGKKTKVDIPEGTVIRLEWLDNE